MKWAHAISTRLRRLKQGSTPKTIRVLIVVLSLANVIIGLAVYKKTRFPLSVTNADFISSMIDSVTLWTGRIFWTVIILFSVLIPLIKGRPVELKDPLEFTQGILNRVREILNKVVVGLLALGASILLLAGLTIAYTKASAPPAPSASGRLVLPTDRSSLRLYVISPEGVGVYNRREVDDAGRFAPIQVFPLKDAGRIESIAVSYDQKRIFATDPQHGQLHVLNTDTAEEEKRINVGKTAGSVSLSGDGRKLYVGVVGPVPEGEIRVFDTGTLEAKGSIRGLGCPVSLFAASKAPLLFVATQCGGGRDPVYVIDTREDRIIATVPGFAVGNAIVATPDGSKAFVSTGDKLLILEGYRSATPKVHGMPLQLSTLAITLDGNLLLVGTPPGIRSLEVKGSRWCSEVGLEEIPSAIAVAPDGAVFAQLPARIFVTDVKALGCK